MRTYNIKVQKERLSILFCCNMSGTEKLKTLVIGKALKPRGFPKVQYRSNLPVIYK